MKRKKRTIVAGLILIIVVFATLLPIIVNHSEKDLIRKTLEIALIKQEMPDYEMIMDKEGIILSTENIDRKIIPTLPGVNLITLSPDEIQEKANKEGDFLYLRFNKVEIGIFKSSVSLDNVWICSKDSDKGYLSGGGFILSVYNVLGRWIESPVRQSWIS